MNSRLRSTATLTIALLLPLPILPLAQAQNNNDEEVFILSPFSVDTSSDGGYRSSRNYSKNHSNNTKLVSTKPTMTISGASIEGIEVGDYSKFTPETDIRIRFAIGFYDDEEIVRRNTLNRYLDQISQTVAAEKDIVFEAGAIHVPEGDKGWSRSKSRSDFASLAHFTLSFPSESTQSPFERVRTIRRLIESIKFDSKYAKIFFGEANLVNSYRNGVSPIDGTGTIIAGIVGARNQELPIIRPNVPVFVIKKADSLNLKLFAKFIGSSKEELTADLDAFLSSLKSHTSPSGKTTLQLNRTHITQAQNMTQSGERKTTYQARANITISIDIHDQTNSREYINELKHSILIDKSTQNAITLEFETPNLVINNPDKYRVDILKKIAADTHVLSETIGEDFDVELSIASSRVQVWQHSESEIQCWIPYNQNIVSIRNRQIEEQERTRTHEIAMKDTRPQIVCCTELQSTTEKPTKGVTP